VEQKAFGDVTRSLRERADAATPRFDSTSAHLRTLESQIEAIARGDLATVLAHATEM
jgi:hypothetical protein